MATGTIVPPRIWDSIKSPSGDPDALSARSRSPDNIDFVNYTHDTQVLTSRGR